jgi:hypothetical protein
MVARRVPLYGLFAVLLALMVQLGAGIDVPRIDPLTGLATLCHAAHQTDGAPSRAPSRSADCLLCPLCIALHAPSALPALDAAIPLKRIVAVVVKAALPPPSTAPPSEPRRPSQPRAPPTVS